MPTVNAPVFVTYTHKCNICGAESINGPTKCLSELWMPGKPPGWGLIDLGWRTILACERHKFEATVKTDGQPDQHIAF